MTDSVKEAFQDLRRYLKDRGQDSDGLTPEQLVKKVGEVMKERNNG